MKKKPEKRLGISPLVRVADEQPNSILYSNRHASAGLEVTSAELRVRGHVPLPRIMPQPRQWGYSSLHQQNIWRRSEQPSVTAGCLGGGLGYGLNAGSWSHLLSWVWPTHQITLPHISPTLIHPCSAHPPNPLHRLPSASTSLPCTAPYLDLAPLSHCTSCTYNGTYFCVDMQWNYWKVLYFTIHLIFF